MQQRKRERNKNESYNTPRLDNFVAGSSTGSEPFLAARNTYDSNSPHKLESRQTLTTDTSQPTAGVSSPSTTSKLNDQLDLLQDMRSSSNLTDSADPYGGGSSSRSAAGAGATGHHSIDMRHPGSLSLLSTLPLHLQPQQIDIPPNLMVPSSSFEKMKETSPRSAAAAGAAAVGSHLQPPPAHALINTLEDDTFAQQIMLSQGRISHHPHLPGPVDIPTFPETARFKSNSLPDNSITEEIISFFRSTNPSSAAASTTAAPTNIPIQTTSHSELVSNTINERIHQQPMFSLSRSSQTGGSVSTGVGMRSTAANPNDAFGSFDDLFTDDTDYRDHLKVGTTSPGMKSDDPRHLSATVAALPTIASPLSKQTMQHEQQLRNTPSTAISNVATSLMESNRYYNTQQQLNNNRANNPMFFHHELPSSLGDSSFVSSIHDPISKNVNPTSTFDSGSSNPIDFWKNQQRQQEQQELQLQQQRLQLLRQQQQHQQQQREQEYLLNQCLFPPQPSQYSHPQTMFDDLATTNIATGLNQGLLDPRQQSTMQSYHHQQQQQQQQLLTGEQQFGLDRIEYNYRNLQRYNTIEGSNRRNSLSLSSIGSIDYWKGPRSSLGLGIDESQFNTSQSAPEPNAKLVDWEMTTSTTTGVDSLELTDCPRSGSLMRKATSPAKSPTKGSPTKARNSPKPKLQPHVRKRRCKGFPEKLMDAIIDYESKKPDNEEILTWLPDGKTFVVVDPDAFLQKVLNHVFKEAKYTSFIRKLHRWGFSRLSTNIPTTSGKSGNSDCFYHPLFDKNRRDLVAKISCNNTFRTSSTTTTATSSTTPGWKHTRETVLSNLFSHDPFPSMNETSKNNDTERTAAKTETDMYLFADGGDDDDDDDDAGRNEDLGDDDDLLSDSSHTSR